MINISSLSSLSSRFFINTSIQKSCITPSRLSMTCRYFAGHSKWANIKHKKAKNDQEKQAQAARFSRDITIAVRKGGPDPNDNFHLDAVIRRALRANINKQIIEKAIQVGTGDSKSGAMLESILYEGVGPGGALFVVDAITDNKKRTAPVIRHLFTKHGGSIGAGSSLFNFDLMGHMEIIPGDNDDLDALVETSIDCGAEDVVVDDENNKILVYCAPSDLEQVSKAFKAVGHQAHNESIIRKPKNMFDTQDETIVEELSALVDDLEAADDVQAVYHNIA